MEKPAVIAEKKSNQLPEEIVSQAYFCLECGKCNGICPMVELFPLEFHPRNFLSELIIDPASALAKPDLWLCASCYKCNKRCPQAIELPRIFLILRKRILEKQGITGLKKAIGMISEKIPFPASFFSVCFHPERIPMDRPVFEEIINECFTSVKIAKNKEKKKKVAVIGSGPAGLMAGHELQGKGYQVTVFESQTAAGGMFVDCIPESRIKGDVIHREIENLLKEGIEIITNTRVGKDIEFTDLLNNGYEAVFIGSGARQCMKLNIDGEDLEGVYDSLEYLAEVKSGKKQMKAGRVVVIGAGNTAMDVASLALDLGSTDVTILYRRSANEMPADKNEVIETETLGAKILFLTAPVRFLGKANKIHQVECVKMELGKLDMSGRKAAFPIENTNFMIDADQAIISVGEKPDTGYLPDQIKLAGNGRIAINPVTMETCMQGIFAGGDVVLGPATIAEAIVAGKRAANEIDKFLRSK